MYPAFASGVRGGQSSHAAHSSIFRNYSTTTTPIYTANPIIPPILPISTADSYPTEAPHTPSTAGPHLAATFCLAVEIGRIGRRLSLRVNNGTDPHPLLSLPAIVTSSFIVFAFIAITFYSKTFCIACNTRGAEPTAHRSPTDNKSSSVIFENFPFTESAC